MRETGPTTADAIESMSWRFCSVKGRADQRVAEIITWFRSNRLICRDETSARVNGRQKWAWVFPNTEVCMRVIRPSRGLGVHPTVLAARRPTIWVSDLSSAQQNHPAEPSQVCAVVCLAAIECPFYHPRGEDYHRRLKF